MKIFTTPQHTRSILPLFHPDKILRLYCVGGIFLFHKQNLSCTEMAKASIDLWPQIFNA